MDVLGVEYKRHRIVYYEYTNTWRVIEEETTLKTDMRSLLEAKEWVDKRFKAASRKRKYVDVYVAKQQTGGCLVRLLIAKTRIAKMKFGAVRYVVVYPDGRIEEQPSVYPKTPITDKAAEDLASLEEKANVLAGKQRAILDSLGVPEGVEGVEVIE